MSRVFPRKAVFPRWEGKGERERGGKGWRGTLGEEHASLFHRSAAAAADGKGAVVLINYSSRRRQGHSRGARLKLATPQSFPRSLKRS